MSKLNDIMTGLEIFAKYGGTDCCAEHDELHAGPSGKVGVSLEDIVKLQGAGWMAGGENCDGCAEEGDPDDAVFLADPEDPESPRHRRTCIYWSIFT